MRTQAVDPMRAVAVLLVVLCVGWGEFRYAWGRADEAEHTLSALQLGRDRAVLSDHHTYLLARTLAVTEDGIRACLVRSNELRSRLAALPVGDEGEVE